MLKKTIGMGGFTLAEGATHVDMLGKARKSAFTLAEVLITLGIIGVVAAMTMPTLINSTNGAQYKTAYKKALSVMSQAVVMNIALDDYDLSQTIAGANDASKYDSENQTIYTLFKNRMNVVKVQSGAQITTGTGADVASDYKIIDGGDKNDIINTAAATFTDGVSGGGHGGTATVFSGVLGNTNITWPTAFTFLFYNDGIVFAFDNTQSDCRSATRIQGDNYCYGWIDVNGMKGPNKVVRCDAGSLSATTKGDDTTCTVSNPSDIYPIAFYDQTIIPASAAARAVLYAK